MQERTTRNNSGHVLLELALVLSTLLLLVIGSLECVNYMRARQIVQAMSREAAILTYKKCSGYQLRTGTPADADRPNKCVDQVAMEVLTSGAQVTGADVFISVHRCGPLAGGGCSNDVVATTNTLPVHSNHMKDPGDPLRALLASQRVVVISEVHYGYQYLLNIHLPFFGRTISEMLSLSAIKDVTIL